MKILFLTGGVIGAAMVYFLDPKKGGARRQQLGPLKEKAAPLAQKVAPIAQKVTPVVEKVAPIAQKVAPVAEKIAPVAEKITPVPVKEAVAPIAEKMGGAQNEAATEGDKRSSTHAREDQRGPDNSDPDDSTLRDRIESEIFRDPKTSRQHINVNVANGVVELRGEQATQEDIDTLVKTVHAIANGKDVHNYLHLPGTTAPNKEPEGEAS
ncbi:MAG: hypothetical protein NVSMB52_08950 [Chloroflexota bacterium]